MRNGICAALLAYCIWGFSPLYWRLLADVPPDQLVMHRIVWSFLIVLVIVVATQWQDFRQNALTWSNLQLHGTAAYFIGANWALFVWAVNSGFVVQASLGNYILPLVTVLLGVVVLREHLRPWQWFAIGLAAVGVVVVSIGYGVVPWISFALATTEGIYGLFKKKATLPSLQGVVLETGALFVPAVAYLLYAESRGVGSFGHGTMGKNELLFGAGIMATSSLVSFGYAVLRIPLTLTGVLRYITPTIQVCLAVFVYHEPFSTVNFVGFVLLWIALAIFSVQSYFKHQQEMRRKTQVSLLSTASTQTVYKSV
ncbi:hypothetical protein DYB37_010005 [Aphanomyces astaci]|uniref:EamA domain-containing protein n=2 Tax=Aphanomyces astaci TaxID=112090 RepID=A0A397AZA7_APHAT|nr:hypothetical protein DYB25_011977 [Aphanomyces astaci]RHY12932.1 hypothetical protein DYB36_003708 [Aphanomyces astaci]RHY45119.1 hypothetical protein DYB30_012556 [Aphanomyces astaci]RHY52628.1 hypothetical protein DYB34_012380 [Aphanomyces astaci]RHY75921.1 hypothetical protein DYB38_013836 [Aphanomyces astaci]